MMLTLFYSPVVLGETLHKEMPAMAEAWDCVRKATLFYLKGRALLQHDTYDEQKRAFDELRGQASRQMWRYAELMETHGPASLMTLNLRTCVVHLWRQELETGAIHASNEWWVEREIKRAGTLGTHILSLRPEVIIGNKYLALIALDRSERLLGKRRAATLAMEAIRPCTTRHRQYDDASKEVHLVGPSDTTLKEAATLDEAFLGIDMQCQAMHLIREASGRQELCAQDVRILVFHRCSIWGEEITCMEYGRQQTRVSYNVCLLSRHASLEGGGDIGSRQEGVAIAEPERILGAEVASVHRYYMVVGRAPTHTTDRVLARLALVTVFNDCTPTERSGMGYMMVQQWGEALVPIEEFSAKCILHQPSVPTTLGRYGVNQSEDGGEDWYAIPLWGIQPGTPTTRPY